VGDPLADKILLFGGAQISLAPDSNALRVLNRLGYGEENEKNYTKSYKSTVASTANEFRTAGEAQRAHLLLASWKRDVQEISFTLRGLSSAQSLSVVPDPLFGLATPAEKRIYVVPLAFGAARWV
jgi:hypothetical protein